MPTQPPVQQMRTGSSLGAKVGLWVVFVVIVAAASPLLTLFIAYLSGSNLPSRGDLLADGDGYLMAIAISADGLARAFDKSRSKARSALIAMCVLIILISLPAYCLPKAQTLRRGNEIRQALARPEGTNSKELERVEKVAQEESEQRKKPTEYTSVLIVSVSMLVAFVIVLMR